MPVKQDSSGYKMNKQHTVRSRILSKIITESLQMQYSTLASDSSTGEPQCAKEHEHVVAERSRAAWTMSSRFQSKEYQTMHG